MSILSAFKKRFEINILMLYWHFGSGRQVEKRLYVWLHGNKWLFIGEYDQSLINISVRKHFAIWVYHGITVLFCVRSRKAVIDGGIFLGLGVGSTDFVNNYHLLLQLTKIYKTLFQSAVGRLAIKPISKIAHRRSKFIKNKNRSNKMTNMLVNALKIKYYKNYLDTCMLIYLCRLKVMEVTSFVTVLLMRIRLTFFCPFFKVIQPSFSHSTR